MNHLRLFFKLLVVTSLFILSCSENRTKDESSNEKGKSDPNSRFQKKGNQLFGELAIILYEYKSKIANLEVKRKSIRNFENGIKLNREIKALKAKADSSFANHINNFNHPLILPIKQEGNKVFYRLSEMIVVQATIKVIVLSANVNILKMPFPGDTIFIQLLGEKGRSHCWLKFATSDTKKVGNICRYNSEINSEDIIGITKAIARTLRDYESAKEEKSF